MAVPEIDLLAGVEMDELVAAFNDAFSSYAVPMRLTADKLALMIRARDVDLTRSYGAFEGGSLRGFLLNGFRVIDGARTAYDSGTGVVQACQGRGLGRLLMEHALARLAHGGVEHYVLEVLTVNEPAIALYEGLGFETTRTLHCFERSAREGGEAPVASRSIEQDWARRVGHLHAFRPSWQNANEAVSKLAERCVLLETGDDSPTAFGVLEKPTGNLMQFGFLPGHEDAARAILRGAARASEHDRLRCLNIDARAASVLAVLESEGFTPVVSQLEMVRALP